MPESDPRAKRYAKALLRDPDFTRLLDEDLAAEQSGDVDPGLTREEFLAKYKDLLEPPAERRASARSGALTASLTATAAWATLADPEGNELDVIAG